jgi:enterochelin esterase-like enzyme
LKVSILLGLGGALLAGCLPSSIAPSTVGTIASSASTPTPTPFLAYPVPTIESTPECLDDSGEWLDFPYLGTAVEGEVSTTVYLPPCYDVRSTRYPVAYFLHGKPYTEDQWLDLGLAELVEKGTQAGTLPAMILVLARQPEPLFSGSDGGPDSYEMEFLEGLMASTDQAFRTEPSPDRRAIVGISRGGVWALEIALRNPDRIGAVAALSPALAVNAARPAYDPPRLASTAPALPARLMLGAGDTDWARRATEELAAVLQTRGAAIGLIIVPGGHTDPTWESMLPAVLDFLSAAFSGT